MKYTYPLHRHRSLLLCLLLICACLPMGIARAQDIYTTVPVNSNGSDVYVDIKNPTSGNLYFFSDPSPSEARMGRVSGGTEFRWPSIGNFQPDPQGFQYNRMFPGEYLRVYPKTLSANTEIRVEFSYSQLGPRYNYHVFTRAGARVDYIYLLDPVDSSQATTVHWRVAFDQPISNVTAANFALESDISGVSIVSVTPDTAQPSANWTVTATTGNTTGSIRLLWVGHETETPSVANPYVSQYPYQFGERIYYQQNLPTEIVVLPNTTKTLKAIGTRRSGRELFFQWYTIPPGSSTPAAIPGARDHVYETPFTSSSYTPPAYASGSHRYFCSAFGAPDQEFTENSYLYSNTATVSVLTLNAAAQAGFTNTVATPPYNLATATGAFPAGGAFSGNGVSGDLFNPATAGLGVHTIIYSIGGVQVSFTITVNEQPSLNVTTKTDVTNQRDGLTSLREALVYAQSLGGAQTVTFVSALAGQTVTLGSGWNDASDDTALRISGDITIDGGDSANPINLVIPQGTQRRHLIAGNGLLQLKNLSFQGGNLPSNGSGGVALLYGTAQLTNVRCENNQAGEGGALFLTNTANVQITNSVFQSNTATNGTGGAISNGGGTLIVNDSSLSGNAAGSGGAINSYGSLTVRRTTFNNNSSGFNGGALRLFGTADIAESTFSNNRASNGGGGLISHGNTALTNVTFALNTAVDGGGAQLYEGTASLRHVTIARNTATGDGGGTNTPFANVTAINTIVSGNTAATNPNLSGAAFNTASSNNLLNLTADAAFLGGLSNNGGPTQTIALLPGSPAIDVGLAIANLTSDQRGTARPQGAATDIGAFELIPSQAANIPIVGPLGGSYQDGVEVSIASTSARTAVRYTLDGSTPSPTNGLLYTGPFSLTRTATVKAIAYNGGWLPSQIASVSFTVLTPLPYWRNMQGLPADGSQDLATPASDGVANLLKYAFNMAPNAGDLLKPNIGVLPENGTAGLPYIEVDGQGRLTIEFVRRKASTNPGITYLVETGDSLSNLTPLSLNGAVIVSLDEKWERVTVVDPTVSAARFGRVRVQSLGTYFNDFNAALGAATLRGSAIYTNNTIQLTDTVGGQVGAVTFDGINLAPSVTGFTAKFNLQLGPTASGVPADGASFAVGNLGAAPWDESGPGGTHHIAVGFDTYESGGTGAIGIHLWVNGVHVAANATNPYTNGQFVPVEISYDAASGLTLRYNGGVIFDHTSVSGFIFQSTDKFGLGARTGGANERCLVDDVQIAPR